MIFLSSVSKLKALPLCATKRSWTNNFFYHDKLDVLLIVFNIKSNDYRLVVAVDFEKSIVWIK